MTTSVHCANPRVESESIALAYTYDGSLEGLFSAVFAAYERHEDPLDIVSADLFQARLGQEERFIQTNQEHSLRVANGIIKAGGYRTFRTIRRISTSSDPRAGTAIYRFIRRQMKEPGYLLDRIADPLVSVLFELNRSVANECEYMRQFMRFTHLENGGWLAVCNPKHNVVALIMDHFTQRFNDQPFVIYDEVHHIAGVYEGSSWYLVNTASLQVPSYSSEEDLMQQAWRVFYNTLSVEARYNPELRRQHMPVRFWKNLTEMQEHADAR